MARLFKWWPQTRYDGLIDLTGFDNAEVGDYLQFVDPRKNCRILRRHPDYRVFIEKYHNVYFCASGTLDYFATFQERDDADVQYLIDNFAGNPYGPLPQHVALEVDWPSRTILLRYRSDEVERNVWQARDHHYCLKFPTRLEAATPNLSMACLTIEPTYKWSYMQVRLDAGQEITFDKTNLSFDHYFLVMLTDVQATTPNGQRLAARNVMNKLTSDTITFNATEGDTGVCIIQRTDELVPPL